MSKNLRRDPIKYVRDKAKSGYVKDSECFICGSTDNLDFHHFHTMTPLFNAWCRKNGHVLRTDDEVLNVREDFIAQHKSELYDETITLCHEHHMKLHSVYGKDPALTTAEKQKRWANIQREKLHGIL